MFCRCCIKNIVYYFLIVKYKIENFCKKVFLEKKCAIFYIIDTSDKDEHFLMEDMKMERLAKTQTKIHMEVVAEKSGLDTQNSAMNSEYNQN